MSSLLPREVIDRYDTAGPRYTSYPTAPEWSALTPTNAATLLTRHASARRSSRLSLYAHVPFCKKLCFYCGCNMLVTRRESVVDAYLDAIACEVERLVERSGTQRREVVQMHWGGGTPTFLSEAQIVRLFRTLTAPFELNERAEISIEVHPPVTTKAQLETLALLGFNRLSMGIQDFDPDVQRAVNRIQPFSQTQDLITEARSLGFVSIGTDLMYGLPLQNVERFDRTLALVAELRPDRIALFNYAHMPWARPNQRLIVASDLPSREMKIALFERALERLSKEGYEYIGMDHFALPTSELVRAQHDKTLRRNFMGYTTCAASDVLAFGVSSISDLDGVYLANARSLPEYLERITRGELAIERGLELSPDDKLRRDVINSLACYGELDKRRIGRAHGISFDAYFAESLARLAQLEADGLVSQDAEHIRVTPRGRLLLRNVCMVFDVYMQPGASQERRYSRTI